MLLNDESPVIALALLFELFSALARRFNALFPHIGNGDHYLDKYNIGGLSRFDFKKKYVIQKKNNITYVKLRLCDSSIWAEALSAIFDSNIVF